MEVKGPTTCFVGEENPWAGCFHYKWKPRLVSNPPSPQVGTNYRAQALIRVGGAGLRLVLQSGLGVWALGCLTFSNSLSLCISFLLPLEQITTNFTCETTHINHLRVLEKSEMGPTG